MMHEARNACHLVIDAGLSKRRFVAVVKCEDVQEYLITDGSWDATFAEAVGCLHASRDLQ